MLRRFILLCCCMLVFMPVSAQIQIISREKLDSISNPALAADSARLRFDITRIVAQPMNEDDDPKDFVFRFRNVSDKKILISRLSATCTCVEAKCSKRVIEAGEEAAITLTYHPKGHPGSFERKVFVYTDDNSRPSAILKLQVSVGVGSDLSGIYPIGMGKIRLRSRNVNVSSSAKSVERLKYLNDSGKDFKLDCDELMLPDCLQVRSEPEIVKDGEEGEIVIVFDPEIYAKGIKRPGMQIVLKGTGLPPSQSSIIVSVDKK